MLRIINDYLDKMEDFEIQVEEEIDKIILSLDIDELMDNPESELAQAAQMLTEILEQKYHPKVVKIGREFAENVESK